MDVDRTHRFYLDSGEANGFSLQGQKTLKKKELLAEARSGLKLLQSKDRQRSAASDQNPVFAHQEVGYVTVLDGEGAKIVHNRRWQLNVLFLQHSARQTQKGLLNPLSGLGTGLNHRAVLS